MNLPTAPIRQARALWITARAVFLLGLAVPLSAASFPQTSLRIDPSVMLEPVVGIEEGELLASAPSIRSDFGDSVAIHGDTAVVGASSGATSVGISGSADVFVRSGGGWIWQARLIASDAASGDLFGQSVSIHGDTIVVGAPFAEGTSTVRSGAAYVFTRSGTTWSEQAKLTDAAATTANNFGRSVSVHGDTVVIGAPLEGSVHTWAGAAFVFRRSGALWAQAAKLTTSEPPLDARWDRFGTSVSISGDLLLVGAPFANNGTIFGTGSAYIFRKPSSGWQDTSASSRLETSRLSSNASFGVVVSLSGDTALIGAPFDKHLGSGVVPGSAFLFTPGAGGWVLESKLVASDPVHLDNFGRSVSLSNNTALIGAPDESFPGSGLGAAYVFARGAGGWSEVEKLVASDGVDLDHFGHAVGVSADRVFVSAPDHTDGGVFQAGSTYAIRLTAEWLNLGGGIAGTQGTPILSGDGTLIPESPIRLSLRGGPPTAPALLIIGASAIEVPLFSGVLIPALDVLVPLSTDSSGNFDYVTVIPGSATAPAYFFQVWLPDPGAPGGRVATDGLQAATP